MHDRLVQERSSKFWQWVDKRENDHLFFMMDKGLDKAVWKWSHHPSKKVPFRKVPFGKSTYYTKLRGKND
jgi:hypothetical protein